MEGIIIPSLNILRKPFYTRKMREITVQNNESFDLTNFQIDITLDGVFYTLGPNNLVLTCDGQRLSYWVEEFSFYRFVRLWTKLMLPASSTKIIQLWYDGCVPWGQSPEDTMLFFDCFDSDRGWNKILDGGGSYTIEDGYWKMTGGSDDTKWVSNDSFEAVQNLRVLTRVKKAFSGSGSNCQLGIAASDASGTISLGCDYPSSPTAFKRDPGWVAVYTDSLEILKWRRLEAKHINGVSFDLWSYEWDEKVLLGSDTADTQSSTTSDRCFLKCYGGEYWLDWIALAKATTNSPTVTIGAEKSVFRSW